MVIDEKAWESYVLDYENVTGDVFPTDYVLNKT